VVVASGITSKGERAGLAAGSVTFTHRVTINPICGFAGLPHLG
jgi:hypothetical protein